MAQNDLPERVVRNILIGETSSVRFEHFCCDLFTDAHARDYVPTSRSYDLGRDGRSSSELAGSGCGVICCTLQKEIDRKSEDDIKRVLESVIPEEILFCTAQDKSEQSLREIERKLESFAPPSVHVSAFGAIQLVSLVQRYPSSFERRYAADLMEYRSFLSESQFSSLGMQEEGLRLALATQFQDDAQSLRQEVLTTAVLFTLSDGKKHTITKIAKGVSDRLHLPRIIHEAYFRDCLRRLSEEGAVTRDKEFFQLAEAGRELVAVREERQANAAVEGSRLFREDLESLLGERVNDTEFSFLWKRLQDELANLFFSSGLKVIRAIASLTSGPALPEPSRSYAGMLSDLRERICSIMGGGPHGEAIAQAVSDVLEDTNSSAFRWFMDVAINFVTMCSLGLEPTAQQEVSGRLKEMDLVLDTDVVLTYLSEGERAHKVVTAVLERWRETGGRLLVIPSVLEEAVYHAWIAENEYQELWRDLSSMKSDEIHRYAANAFVRAFYNTAPGEYNPRNWARFIAEYRGAFAKDTSKLKLILQDAGFDLIDDCPCERAFAKKVIDEIYALRGISQRDYVPKQIGDKVARDGEMIANLKHRREESKSGYDTSVIISSSPLLQEVTQKFSADLMEPAPVWPIGAIAYLVSLLPGVSMTLQTLRAGLFVDYSQDAMDTITRLAMRVIRHSPEYDLGYSRRPTLKKALVAKISRAARERRMRPADLVACLVDPTANKGQLLTEVIAAGVDEIVASKHEKEIDALHRKLEGRR